MSQEDQDMRAVQMRLTEIAAQFRWVKVSWAVLLLMVASLLLMDHAEPAMKSIEASEFLLRDATGKLRGRLATTSEGPSLELLGPDQDVGIRIRLGEKGPKIAMFDATRELRALVTVADGESGLYFYDAAGITRAELGVTSDGKYGQLNLHDADGTRRQVLSAGQEASSILLYDTRGKIRATLGVGQDYPELTLSDNGGRVRAKLIVRDSGPALAFSDEQTVRLVLGSTELQTKRTGEIRKLAPSSLIMLDSEGETLWSAP